MLNRSSRAITSIAIAGILAACSGGASNNVMPASSKSETQNNAHPQGNAAHSVRYQLIDLGTFGGPGSSINGGEALNQQGTLTGGADTATADPFCFLDCFDTHTFKWDRGVLTDLGTLPGGALSQGNSISPNGLISGNSFDGKFDPAISFAEIRAVLYENGAIVDTGHLPGGNSSLVTFVNDRAQIVGLAFNATPDPFSLFLPGIIPVETRAFLWQHGVMQDIGTLGGDDAIAGIINQAGEIAGFSYTNSTPNATTGLPTLDPFFWKNGVMTDIGTLGGTNGTAVWMNNRGQVVGNSNLVGDSAMHPFLWDRGALTDLGTLGGNNGITNFVNDKGDIVGKADLPVASPQKHDAVLWHNGQKIDLGTVPGDACSNALAVNSAGQVVGTSENQTLCLIPAGEHAFLWENGGPMVDLNTLIPPGSNFQLVQATNINDRGEIAGFGRPAGCSNPACSHAYVLVPCNVNSASGCAAKHLNAALATPRSSMSVIHKPANPLLRSPWLQCRRSSCKDIAG